MIRYLHPRMTGRRPVLRVALVMLAVPSVALAPVGVAGASADATAAAAAAPVVVPARHPDIQYLGRWGRLAEAMTTVNSGFPRDPALHRTAHHGDVRPVHGDPPPADLRPDRPGRRHP